jgi:hypothetical protein
MRLLAWLVITATLGLAGTACGGGGTHTKHAAYDRLLRAQLARAKRRKAMRLREDNMVLRTIRVYPGSTCRKNQNPEGMLRRADPPDSDSRAAALALYADNSRVLSVQDYLDWSAVDWGTFLNCRAPHGSSPPTVYTFLVRQVPPTWHQKPAGEVGAGGVPLTLSSPKDGGACGSSSSRAGLCGATLTSLPTFSDTI